MSAGHAETEIGLSSGRLIRTTVPERDVILDIDPPKRMVVTKLFHAAREITTGFGLVPISDT